MLLGCCVHSCNNFKFMFTLRCRKADFVASVIAGEADVIIAGVVVTGDLTPLSLTPAINIKLQIFVKIRNDPNRILMGQGETDS